jgi:hypothetical protein
MRHEQDPGCRERYRFGMRIAGPAWPGSRRTPEGGILALLDLPVTGPAEEWRHVDARPRILNIVHFRATNMHYRVFYFFERSGECVSSASAVEMSAKAIREQLLGRLHSVDDYIGIIDESDNVLQVLIEPEKDRFWVELPMDAARASYGRFMSFEELEEMVLSLPKVLDRRHIPNLEYRPW